jgi:hypothetical protein
VPVFGICAFEGSSIPQTTTGYVCAGDGLAVFYMDFLEAEKACSALGDDTRVVGVPLDTVYFNSEHCLKPSDSAMDEAQLIPAARRMVPDASTPLFCIDGMLMTDKETGGKSLPLFFSREELLAFARPIYGDKIAEEEVLLTDLGVVVSNLINGPAGLLRDSKFFAAVTALQALEKLEDAKRQAVFGPGKVREQLGLFGQKIDDAGLFPF